MFSNNFTEWFSFQGPNPEVLTLRGRNIYLYPPDEYVGMDTSSQPPEEKLQLEWV